MKNLGWEKYKIGLRTNMKNSSKEIRIANACFPFLKFCHLLLKHRRRRTSDSYSFSAATGCKRIVCTLVRSNKLFLLTGVATTTDTKAPPISQAYLVTYINVFLLFSIRLMFYKVLCCMFTYLYHRNSFLLNNATSVSFLVLLHGNRWRCFSQCFTSSKS